MIQEAQQKADPVEALEMDEQIAYWEGVKANIIESLDEVKNSEARERIAAGEAVAGWYSGRQVYLYMPNIKDRRNIELTYVHEVVAHHGVKAIKSLSQELNTPAEIVTDIESIADERKKRDAKKG